MATARTIGEWVEQATDNRKFSMWKATLVMNDNGESDIFTKATPKTLDPTKPFTIMVQCSNTPDGSALPINLWVGSGNFALKGDTTTVAVDTGTGAKFMQILDNVVAAVTYPYSILLDPKLSVADVVAVASIASGLKARIPMFPRYIIHFDGASTLTASITYYVWLIQEKV